MTYVSMIDIFMSGWGPAEGKVNIFCIECDSAEQAERVAAYAETRDEMKRVRVHNTERLPYWAESNTLVTRKHIDELGSIWQGE